MVDRELSINATEEQRATVALIEERTFDNLAGRGEKFSAAPDRCRHFGLLQEPRLGDSAAKLPCLD
jgi:hypothetical protein